MIDKRMAKRVGPRWNPNPTTAAEVDEQVTGYYTRTAAAMPPATNPSTTTITEEVLSK